MGLHVVPSGIATWHIHKLLVDRRMGKREPFWLTLRPMLSRNDNGQDYETDAIVKTNGQDNKKKRMTGDWRGRQNDKE
jgi:hypothetical protein